MKSIRSLLLILLIPIAALAVEVCEVTPPMAALTVPYVSKAPELNTDPHSAIWSHAASAWIEKDCTLQLDYPKLKTEVRAFWTDSDLYLLFVSPYTELNLWLRRGRIFFGRRFDQHPALPGIRDCSYR